MNIIDKQEVQEDEITYIIETYNNGTINKYIKPQDIEIEPTPAPITNEDILNAMQSSHIQRGHTELNGVSVTIPLEPVDVSRATVSISGPVKAYTLSAEALAVTLTDPGYINWEVRE